MASLTQTSTIARKIIRFALYFIILLIIGRIFLNVGAGIYRSVFPKAPPPPTVAYGRLPKINFPQGGQIPQNVNWTLETPEGGLPNFTTQLKVYLMPSSSSNLLSLDSAKKLANSLRFNSEPEKVTDTVFKFSHSLVPSTLEMNIISRVFSISYNLASDPSPISKRPPAPEVAEDDIRDYLKSAGILPEDLTGRTSHEFLKIEGGKFVNVVSLSEADAVKINFFRKDYDSLASVTPDPYTANVWFIISGSTESDKKILASNFHHFLVSEDKYSTYPIKTSEIAWEDLKGGRGYIANLGEGGANIVIRRVYLAYYDPNTPFQFFEPVVVFEGDGGFVAYVPAVAAQYYSE